MISQRAFSNLSTVRRMSLSKSSVVVGGHPGSAELDVQVEEVLPLPHGPQEDGQVTEIGTNRGEPHEVRVDAADLVRHDPDVLGLLRDVHPEGLLDRHAVQVGVGHRGGVAETVRHGDDLGIGPVLGLLLPPPVQVADDGLRINADLSVDLDLQGPQSVRERVLGSHDDPHLVGFHLVGLLLELLLGRDDGRY